MKHLLRSGFSRLWRSKLFYLGILVVAAQVAYTLANNLYYKGLWGLEELTANNLIFAGTYFLPIVMAAFISFFVGVEHGDKTIRNKLTVGHTRSAVYLASLIVCAAAALIMYGVGSAVVIAVGAPLLGGFSGVAHVLILQVLCSCLTVVALTALLLLCAMLITNRAVGVIVSVLLAVGLFLIAPELDNMLSAPETVGGWSYTVNGVLHEVPVQPNPDYLSGFGRVLVQFLHDLLPTGQLYQYGGSEVLPSNLAWFPLYSVLLIALTTVGGIFFFKRKDLK